MIFSTSFRVLSISRAYLIHTMTDKVPVVHVKFAESTALVFGTNDTMVVPPGIPVPVIVAPFAHQLVFATVIAVLPLVAPIFLAVPIVFLNPPEVSSFPRAMKSSGFTVIYPTLPSPHDFWRFAFSVIPSCSSPRFTIVATPQTAVIK